MRHSAKKFIDFILFSNLLIAFAAVAQGLTTYYLLDIKPVNNSVLALLFFATLTIYNLSLLLEKPKNAKKSPFRRIRWLHFHHRLSISITIISTLSLIPLSLFLSFDSLLLLGIAGILSLGYSFPLFTINKKKIGLRSIPGLKLFLIALVWTISTVALPILESNHYYLNHISLKECLTLCAKTFLFIAAITIPFDIRDIYSDKSYDLKTLPTVYGEKKSYIISFCFLLIYLVACFAFTEKLNLDFFALAFTAIVAYWLIFRYKGEKNETYYFLYLDGTLVLQFILLYFIK